MDAEGTWLKPGMKVFAPEGTELGVVKEAGSDAFLVDVPRAPDYWLRIEDAVRRELEEVVTKFPHAELREHTVAAPDEVLLA